MKDLEEIKKEMDIIQSKIGTLEDEIKFLIDDALSLAKYKIDDLVKLKRNGQKGFIKEIFVSPDASYLELMDGVNLVIEYRIGAFNKNGKRSTSKDISFYNFPECIIEPLN